MLKKVFQWVGIILGGLVAVIALVLIVLNLVATERLTRKYTPTVAAINIPTDAEAVARGKHWADTLCIGCHKENLSGGQFFQAPMATIDTANLTPGEGGVGAKFSDLDWVRVLRHGVNEEGRTLVLMPAQETTHLSDRDLGDLIAYLKSLPPVDQAAREPEFNFLGKAMLAAGVFGPDFLPAEVIDHDQRPASYPQPGVTVEYGEYLINSSGCRACHGKTLAGGKSPDPSAIAAPNLTPGGELAAWSVEDFIKTIRTGVAVSGHKLDPEQMPWDHFKNFSDDELKAIFAYLQAQPKLPTVKP